MADLPQQVFKISAIPARFAKPCRYKTQPVCLQSLSWHTDDTDLLCKDADLNGFFILISKNVIERNER